MKKSWFILLTALLVLALSFLNTGKNKHQFDDSYINDLNEMTASLVKDDVTKPFCSGVFINEHDVLTAKHCLIKNDQTLIFLERGIGEVEDEDFVKNVNISTYSDSKSSRGKSANAKVLKMGHTDIALLRFSNQKLNHNVARLTSKNPNVGMPVGIVGHPVGLGWSFTKGHVGFEPRFDVDMLSNKRTMYTQIDSSITFGNSGCGVFDERKNLIGITSVVMENAANISFIIHITEVKKFLKEAGVRFFED